MPDEEFRAGAHDLETPFLFVPHGAPDPVEFKRKYPGWVSFPATFVPHPRPIPKWKIINGQRWPLDKKGRPWPKTRYGRPTYPFDELPPGMPAPGTQYELLRKFDHPTLFWEGEPTPTVEEVLAIGAKARAERAAAAPPPPPQPKRAYDGDGLGPVRDYMDAMAGGDDAMRQAAEDAAYWRAASFERRAMPDAVLERNGATAQVAARRARPQPSGAPEPLAPSKPEIRITPPPNGVVLSDANPDPVLEGRQYAAAPLAFIPPAIELAPAAAAALGAMLGIGAVGVVLNEAKKSPADAESRPVPVAVPSPKEGETPADVLMPEGKLVGEKGNRRGDVRNLLGGKGAAEDLFDRLTKGGQLDTSTTYPGVRKRTRDGKFIGYRETSTSGTPAIDIEDLELADEQGHRLKRLHFPRSM